MVQEREDEEEWIRVDWYRGDRSELERSRLGRTMGKGVLTILMILSSSLKIIIYTPLHRAHTLNQACVIRY